MASDDLTRENELASIFGGRSYRFLTPETLRERFNRLEQSAQDALRRKLDRANAHKPGSGHRVADPRPRKTNRKCAKCRRSMRLNVFDSTYCSDCRH